MSRHTFTAVLIVALVPQHAVAESAEIFPGTLVRVTTPTVAKGHLIGTLVESSATELTVVVPGIGKSTVPLAAITKLEWSNGRHSSARTGALWGAVIGAPTGVWLAAASEDSERAGTYIGLGVTMAVIGGGLGALIGLAFETDGWKEAPHSHVQVLLQPVRGGARAAVTLAW